MQQNGAKSGNAAEWTDDTNGLPPHVDPYRFWFSQFVAAEAGFVGDILILPYLITADSVSQLRQRIHKLEEKLQAQLHVPDFYKKLYFDNKGAARPNGPFQIVALARSKAKADLLAGDIDGVIASSMPLPAPVRPDEHPPSACLEDLLFTDRKIRRIVGLIDTDIAFANARFRAAPDETRIGCYWDMDATAYPFIGRMMGHKQIDGYLSQMAQNGSGEMQLYLNYTHDSYLETWDALPPSKFGHGTGVLDAAVGGEVLDGETQLVCIQLPRYAVGQTHGQFLWFYVLMGLDLISCLSWMAKQEHGARPETLVNVSVGGHGGRHDGCSGLELAMDERISNGDLQAIFLAAGNSYGEQIHASFKGADLADEQQLIWRLPPDDGTSSFLEIWLPDKSSDQLELTVELPHQPPRHFPASLLKPGYTSKLEIDSRIAGTVAVQEDPLVPAKDAKRRMQILLSVRPTALSRPRFMGSPPGMPELAGDWKISLKAGPKLKAEDIVTLWIARDDEIMRLPTGARQSQFTLYSPAAKHITNEGTISDMASGRKTTICAAHWASDRMMTPYSGRGIPKAHAVADRDIYPTASYVADESEAHEGVTVSGYFSGTALMMRGTSVSSPQTLRLALTGALPSTPGSIKDRVSALAETQKSEPVHENKVKAKAQKREKSTPADWGHGRLSFTQIPRGAHGSTNYPRRRRDSI